jgi:hypothetical protein
MKKLITALCGALWLLLFITGATAQEINKKEAHQLANIATTRYCPQSVTDSQATILTQENLTLAWVFPLQPQGFIVISATQYTLPVYAYSETSPFDPSADNWTIWLDLIRQDLSARINHYEALTAKEKLNISSAWQRLLAPVEKDTTFQVWPAAGSTATEGWVITNWTQNSPYNQMCPVDTNAGVRSLAGCPAVTMAQILNYLENIKGTRFSDADDYYHNYGAGNQFWIDDDHEIWQFPSFDTLNKYLDTLEQSWMTKAPLSNSMKAALTFACGTACTQVYTASGSGTFGVGQAAAAFQRFNYTNSRLVFPADTNLNRDLAWNIKNAFPAHLALVNPGETVGHNVVVDGYNTDEFYHFNFGWGGSSNGWYTMPPSSIPYDLTVIEGVVMDIIPDSMPVAGLTHKEVPDVRLFPNPAADYFVLELPPSLGAAQIQVWDLLGNLVFSTTRILPGTNQISTNSWSKGLYIISLKQGSKPDLWFKLIKN